CFPPWYVQQQYQLSDSQAIQQSADPGDSSQFGVDAFHLYGGTPVTTLLLVSAKYSESTALISNGFRDIQRSLPEVRRILDGADSQVQEQSKVLVNLRASVGQLDPSVREKLQLDLRVIHLSSQDSLVISEKTRDRRTRLRTAIERTLPDRASIIREVGPLDMGPRQEITAPATGVTLSVERLQDYYAADSQSKMYLGLGRLSELVELYNKRRDALFAKNVRYYLQSPKNVVRGPAGKMRETLKEICVRRKLGPELFAFYHNGVTVTGRSAGPSPGGIYIAEPYVLNGCQTIKNAFLFLNDPRFKGRIDPERWDKILVPLRVVATQDDELIRTVTINNNRQNAISYASLRSNDPVQIALEQRFRAKGMFYERQQGAFSNLESSNPERFAEEFPKTNNRCVSMIDLARSIAAVMGEVGWADRPGHLFESDSANSRCFSDKRLSSTTFLAFLQNVHDTIGGILKSDLGLEKRGDGPTAMRLKYFAMSLLCRFLAKQNSTEFVSKYGSYLCGGGGHSRFRDELVKVLETRNSGIRIELVDKFMPLPSDDVELLQKAFEKTMGTLNLRDVDPFEVFKGL
ncbi:MAG: AIPR family protein, partial [Thaumarchaeota archaeon]|nr:AIPR family protein [Nitrososphaerota archaeon]